MGPTVDAALEEVPLEDSVEDMVNFTFMHHYED